RTDAVDDGRPGGALVRGDLEAVRRGDDRRVAAGHDAVRRHVLPLGTQLAEGPVLPGFPAVGGEPPPVAHRAVPDLAAWAEPESVDEVPGNRRVRGVAPDLAPATRIGGQVEDSLAVGPDPHAAVPVLPRRQHVNAPAT